MNNKEKLLKEIKEGDQTLIPSQVQNFSATLWDGVNDPYLATSYKNASEISGDLPIPLNNYYHLEHTLIGKDVIRIPAECTLSIIVNDANETEYSEDYIIVNRNKVQFVGALFQERHNGAIDFNYSVEFDEVFISNGADWNKNVYISGLINKNEIYLKPFSAYTDYKLCDYSFIAPLAIVNKDPRVNMKITRDDNTGDNVLTSDTTGIKYNGYISDTASTIVENINQLITVNVNINGDINNNIRVDSSGLSVAVGVAKCETYLNTIAVGDEMQIAKVQFYPVSTNQAITIGTGSLFLDPNGLLGSIVEVVNDDYYNVIRLT